MDENILQLNRIIIISFTFINFDLELTISRTMRAIFALNRRPNGEPRSRRSLFSLAFNCTQKLKHFFPTNDLLFEMNCLKFSACETTPDYTESEFQLALPTNDIAVCVQTFAQVVLCLCPERPSLLMALCN